MEWWTPARSEKGQNTNPVSLCVLSPCWFNYRICYQLALSISSTQVRVLREWSLVTNVTWTIRGWCRNLEEKRQVFIYIVKLWSIKLIMLTKLSTEYLSPFYIVSSGLCGGDGRVIRSVDSSNSPGFETTVRPVTKCVERICKLSVIPGIKAKGIIRCGHIEKKDQGCTARLVYLLRGLFVLCT